jgi:3',5'-cyclic AMP phosphodiesterase CpdA
MFSTWTKLAPGDIAIVHLSDLHYGSSRYTDVWPTVRSMVKEIDPALLLVTGDLVHSPRRKWLNDIRTELDNLDIDYLVCAGNHDWFFWGNRVDFREMFGDRRMKTVLSVAAAAAGVVLVPALGWASAIIGAAGAGMIWGLPLLLGWMVSVEAGERFKNVFDNRQVHGNKEVVAPGTLGDWRIGLLGLDSSRRADAFARGFVDPNQFKELKAATHEKDWELCILLVHHHLLSIPKLEENRGKKIGRLLQLTCMANSGSVDFARNHHFATKPPALSAIESRCMETRWIAGKR